MYSAHSAVNAVTYFARSDNGTNVLTKHFHQKDFEKLKSLGPKAIVTMLFFFQNFMLGLLVYLKKNVNVALGSGSPVPNWVSQISH